MYYQPQGPVPFEDLVGIPEPEKKRLRKLLPASYEDFRENVGVYAERLAVPLNADGVDGPGPDFEEFALATIPSKLLPVPLKGLTGEDRKLAAARNKVNEIKYARAFRRRLHYAYAMALYTPGWGMRVRVKNRDIGPVRFLSGTFRGWDVVENGAQVRYRNWDYGPRKADVMVIGKHPGHEEMARCENFVGKASEPLARALADLGVDPGSVGSWYFTNVVKHVPLDPNKDDLAKSWVKNCKPLLQIELRLVRPKYVLCFGKEATQAVLGAKATVGNMYGRVVDLQVPVHEFGDELREFHHCKAMSVCHPAMVYHKPAAYGDLLDGLGRFMALVRGERVDNVETGLDHRVVTTERHLKQIVDGIVEKSTGTDVIAVDAEWHGDRPTDKGSYLRTVQFSHAPKHAYCVVIRARGGGPAFVGDWRKQLLRLLKSTPGRTVRVGGQFFRADMPWLSHHGIDLKDEFAPPADERPESTKVAGGWDTGYMAHAVQEEMEGGYKLENLAARFCGLPPYDADLRAWKADYCRANGLKDKELEGYGECPDKVLHAYANYDVDATIRLFYAFNGHWRKEKGKVVGTPGLLDRDVYGNSSREAFLTSHLATLPALEMECEGVHVDRDRGMRLTTAFDDAFTVLLKAFRDRVRWTEVSDPATGKVVHPAFKIDSVVHCREFLFGESLNSKVDKVTGNTVRVRPPGALSLGLEPLMSSGKKAKPWNQVPEDEVGVKGDTWPSTGKEVLGIISWRQDEVGEVVGMLRDLRFLNQVRKGTLKPPWRDKDGNTAFVDARVVDPNYEEGEDDEIVARGIDEARSFDPKAPDLRSEERKPYASKVGSWLVVDGGLMYWMDHEGVVRTHFYPVETGRWSSSRPNLQNISKQRDGDYKKILGYDEWDVAGRRYVPKGKYLDHFDGKAKYPFSIRSMITAPEGFVYVECDLKMAELAVLGMAAGDKVMLENVRRNGLKKSHPDFVDVHAAMAFKAFGLDTHENRKVVEDKGKKWELTKECLEVLGHGPKRVAAKNVAFGVPYQRSAEAIARQCREQGNPVEVAVAQELIDNYFETYPAIHEFLEACKLRVTDPGFLCGSYGRWRRFFLKGVIDDALIGEAQRQATNFPIQNCVADYINHACWELWKFRRDHEASGRPETFRFALQIHDALLFKVRIEHLEWLMEEVVGECMTNRVPLWPRDLDGRPLKGVTEPYHLGIDKEVFKYWGEPLDRDWGLANGVPEKYLSKAEDRTPLPPPKTRRGRGLVLHKV